NGEQVLPDPYYDSGWRYIGDNGSDALVVKLQGPLRQYKADDLFDVNELQSGEYFTARHPIRIEKGGEKIWSIAGYDDAADTYFVGRFVNRTVNLQELQHDNKFPAKIGLLESKTLQDLERKVLETGA